MKWETARKADRAALDDINNKLNPGEKQPKGNSQPYYATGARCFIKLGGRPLGICQDFKWSIGYNSTPTYTIDTVFPWDIDVGQAQISATLSKILNPLKGPEAENLFPIMSAAVHQPMIELQVIYKAVVVDSPTEGLVRQWNKYWNVGSQDAKKKQQMTPMEFSMFFCRGMFTSITGNATLGQLSNIGATFLGVAYQHYVSQAFVPYGASYIAQETISEAQGAVSGFTGGFF